jgi:hypothetical protein
LSGKIGKVPKKNQNNENGSKNDENGRKIKKIKFFWILITQKKKTNKKWEYGKIGK